MNRVKGITKDGDAARGWQQWEAMTPHSQWAREGNDAWGPGKSYSMGEGSLTGAVDRGMKLLPKPCRGRDGALYSLNLFTSTFSLPANISHWMNSTRRHGVWKPGSERSVS